MTDHTPMTELEHYIQSRKKDIKEKIYNSILKIEQHFNIKLDYDVTDVGNDIIIKGVDEYSFTVSKWFQSKINPCNLLKFNCAGFPFVLPNSHKTIFFIRFNDDFDIEQAQFRTSFLTKKGNITGLKIFFDKSLELGLIENSYIPSGGGKSSYSLKTSELMCPFSDEVILFRLSYNTNEDVKELLPEYYIPSAYDFNSVEFADRLKVYSMLTL